MPYKTTLKILGLCLALQVAQNYYPNLQPFQDFTPSFIENLKTIPLFLIGLIVHMFSHGSWGHLLGNMFLGIPCMMYLENKIGSKKLLNAYVICGVVSALVQAVLPFSGSGLIGSSGAIFGLFALCCALGKNSIPNRVCRLSLLALALIPQMVALNLGPLLRGVAYGAHIGGMVAGLVIAICLKKD